MLEEFKKFAFKGNAFDLAIGVIMAGAFGKIVDGIVTLLILPIISILTQGVNFDNLFIPLSSAVTATNLVDAQKQGAVLGLGAMVGIIINFLIIAFVLLQLVKASNRFKKAEPSAPPPAPSTSEKLLAEIRDALAGAKGPAIAKKK
jgi:large conductance mechanosensitive channel